MNKEKQCNALPHGGDWAGYEIEYGEKPLDFSMNVNPLGIPACVCDAIAKVAASADRYPDPLCRDLRAAIAKAESTDAMRIKADQVFCGNGAADIIFRLAKVLKVIAAPKMNAAFNKDCTVMAGNSHPVLQLTAPTFSEYETAFASEGWEIRRHPLRVENGFQLDETILEEIDQHFNPEETDSHSINEEINQFSNYNEGPDVLFLCEPNNPTGVTTDPALLKRILKRCQETGTILVIDECFNGFLDDPAAHSMKDFLSEYDNLVILKAFTKLYGMAGVRLGYCLCSNPDIIERLQQAGPPWNVSSRAQTAGIAALQETEHIQHGKAIVRQERPWLINELHRLGITQVYGEANYLLFHCSGNPEDTPGSAQCNMPDSTQAGALSEAPLHEALRSRGILIRDCSNYHGLCKGWYRIAVRTHEENVKLIATLEEIL